MDDAPEAGDPEDFEALWNEWHPRAAAYCRAFPSLPWETIEEIASEAVFRAHRARSRFDKRRPFAPWFFTIVRRLALDALSALGPERRGEAGLGETPSRHEEAEARIEREGESAFVRKFLESRPRGDRELSNLVYAQGLGIGEAATVLGMPAGTAKWRLYQIRRELRKAWEREYGRLG